MAWEVADMLGKLSIRATHDSRIELLHHCAEKGVSRFVEMGLVLGAS
jgi:hypothetical protein